MIDQTSLIIMMHQTLLSAIIMYTMHTAGEWTQHKGPIIMYTI